MSSQNQRPPKRRTAAQRASDVNRTNQMAVNTILGRQTPPPRDLKASRAAYEERHRTPNHRR